MTTYKPHPIDTTDIHLPEELNLLLESLARNVHEVWSQMRISQGWSYGEKHNYKDKRHPMLIPFEDLPEEEKVYDRNTAAQTLKLILKLGYKIEK